jgi:transposase
MVVTRAFKDYADAHRDERTLTYTLLNHFKYHWTNAYTESVNNSIKNIEKSGRGYKFDVLC